MGKITEEKILVSAKFLFANQGYHNTTIKDIVKRSGFSNAILHYYYSNKENLLLKILKTKNYNYNIDFKGDHAMTNLKNFVHTTARFMIFNPEMMKIIYQNPLVGENPKIEKLILSIHNKHKTVYLSIIDRGGINKDVKACKEAEIFYHCIIGTIKQYAETISVNPQNDIPYLNRCTEDITKFMVKIAECFFSQP